MTPALLALLCLANFIDGTVFPGPSVRALSSADFNGDSHADFIVGGDGDVDLVLGLSLAPTVCPHQRSFDSTKGAATLATSPYSAEPSLGDAGTITANIFCTRWDKAARKSSRVRSDPKQLVLAPILPAKLSKLLARAAIALFLIACAAPMRARPALTLGFAVTHAAPAYPAGAATLAAGANTAETLNATTLKVYLTPNVAEKYRDETWPKVGSLLQLAQTPQFRALFARKLTNFVLTTYTFAGGIDGGFTNGLDDLEAASEYAELRELVEYLLTAYRGSGKRFVIQNWEGDFAARGGFEPTRRAPLAATEGMKRWIATRQRAVSDARQAMGEVGVRVDHAFELNALLPDGSDHVGEEVLKEVCVDLVSYSSWECFAPLYDQKENAIERSEHALKTALARLRHVACPSARLYLGEVGLAENELPERLQVMATEWLMTLPEILGDTAGVIWWQLYDNECKNTTCRGLGLLRPDGSKSLILRAIDKNFERKKTRIDDR